MTFVSFGQIIEFKDPVFKSYLVSNLALNTNLDTNITEEEARAFTGDIKVMYATDLSGIEKFPNLNKLECYYGDFTSLDLSQNTKLTNIKMTHTPITELDISVCPLLESLTIVGLDLITLDISKNPTLKYLTCNTETLTKLDASGNPNLQVLNCNSCSLTELDVSSCSSLKQLYCIGNGLRSLDLRTGNNVIMNSPDDIITTGNYLMCISVDNVEWSEATWTSKDPGTLYSEDCTLGIQELKFDQHDKGVVIYDFLGRTINKPIRNRVYIFRNTNGAVVKEPYR